MFFQFGSGNCAVVPNGGNEATNPTPTRFMTLQDIDLTIDQQLKELRGQFKFPDDVAPGDMKITGKVGTGRISIDMFNQIFFADSLTTGEDVLLFGESHSVPSTTPFTVTITPPGSGTFGIDLGVQYASNFAQFTKVSSPSAAGQYSVTSGGVYTFDTADASAGILVSYTYTLTTGRTLTVNNQLLGYGPTFEMWLAEPYSGNNGIHLYSVRMSKLSAPEKRDDYVIVDFEFEAYANASGKVMDFFVAV